METACYIHNLKMIASLKSLGFRFTEFKISKQLTIFNCINCTPRAQQQSTGSKDE